MTERTVTYVVDGALLNIVVAFVDLKRAVHLAGGVRDAHRDVCTGDDVTAFVQLVGGVDLERTAGVLWDGSIR